MRLPWWFFLRKLRKADKFQFVGQTVFLSVKSGGSFFLGSLIESKKGKNPGMIPQSAVKTRHQQNNQTGRSLYNEPKI
jgi:hypothetical protein